MTGFDGNVLAHEIGHYFGLLHTWQGGKFPGFPAIPEFAQYVHHLLTPELFPVVLSTGTFGCHQTGDYICYTPADPGNCCVSPPECEYITCPTGFTHDVFDLPYRPDRTLLMGTGGCRNGFSPGQNQIMVGMLTGHPDWAFLYDAEEPTCQILPYDRGLVIRNCEGIFKATNDPAPPQTPMEEVALSLQNVSSFSCGNSTDANGIYKTFLCLNNPPYNGTDLLSLLPDVEHLYPLNGVTTYDLVLISKHILAVEQFENPFQIIAADANGSGNISAFDIVELRKLILGIYNELPNNSSWRYVPEYCFEDSAFVEEFYDPNSMVGINPFNAQWDNPDEPGTNMRSYGGGTVPNRTSWLDHVSINPYSATAQISAIPWSFIGLKVGDVNCSADLPDLSPEVPDKSFTTLSHAALSTNQVFYLEIKAVGNTPVSAWQLGIDFAEDTLQILQIQSGDSGENFTLDNFGTTGVAEGNLRALNFSATGTGTNLNNKTIFKLRMKALQPVSNIGQRFRLKNAVLSDKFYSDEGVEIENIALQLAVETGSGLTGGGGIGPGQKGSALADYSLSVYPVPFSSEVMFDFDLPNDDQVKVSIFDSFGRLAAERSEALSKGPNSIRLDNLSNQASGLYWYSFESGGHTFFGKIVKN